MGKQIFPRWKSQNTFHPGEGGSLWEMEIDFQGKSQYKLGAAVSRKNSGYDMGFVFHRHNAGLSNKDYCR